MRPWEAASKQLAGSWRGRVRTRELEASAELCPISRIPVPWLLPASSSPSARSPQGCFLQVSQQHAASSGPEAAEQVAAPSKEKVCVLPLHQATSACHHAERGMDREAQLPTSRATSSSPAPHGTCGTALRDLGCWTPHLKPLQKNPHIPK